MLVVSVVISLGHVCALPGHVRSIEMTADPEDNDRAGHDADSAHLASCDATVSKAVLSALGFGAGTPPVVLLSEAAHPPPERSAAPVIESSPPLFLLHASLRI